MHGHFAPQAANPAKLLTEHKKAKGNHPEAKYWEEPQKTEKYEENPKSDPRAPRTGHVEVSPENPQRSAGFVFISGVLLAQLGSPAGKRPIWCFSKSN